MAKSSPSLADLSRMRREAKKAKGGDPGGSSHEPSLQETVVEVSSVALPPKETPSDKVQKQRETRPQSSKTETPQKPQPTSALDPEETKPAETEEQTSSTQSDRRSETSSNSTTRLGMLGKPQHPSRSKFELVPEQKPSEVEEQKKVGRPKGIRSNPDYESTTIRLHKQVKAKARYILSTQPEKMDLQTLLNNLLEDFVREQDV